MHKPIDACITDIIELRLRLTPIYYYIQVHHASGRTGFDSEGE